MTGLVAFNAFNNQVRQILLQLDSVKTMLLNRMDGHPITDGEGNIQTSTPKVTAAVARAG